MVLVFIMNRMNIQGSSSSNRRRLVLGIIVLLLVDVIWVASSELTSYIFQEYNKPFFSTFAKTSMFILYLLGFIVWRPWREQCAKGLSTRNTMFFADAEGYFAACSTDHALNHGLSEPLYVPVKFHDLQNEKVRAPSSSVEKPQKVSRVRFSNLMEIRQLPSSQALEAKLSRMANPPVRDMLKNIGKFTVWQVAKISFFFCFVWFLANYSYQEALSDTEVAIVNILSSTSGFVGLFNLLLLWPGFFLLHYTGFEAFEFPSNLVWMYIVINGLIGTVLSEFLWLWGCLLTSSLIGTLALSLTIPLSIIADMCLQKVSFSWVFFAGAVPVFISFFIVTLLCHYNNWDPVMVGIRRIFAFICRKHRIQRVSEDSEQSQSLIPLHNVSQDNDTCP
ncbi:hypothetical protein GDO86_016734 [Hymenochirus boettgeri]|uniref:Solute carrier family 35 member F5 n=1 Tax=Hymenochirus boettgeri TaxID=247094 RepID=A0A8T2IM89_9PIPI|nr:hypothetical protein GDO86_016734 [Hymenochirus boettgeri]